MRQPPTLSALAPLSILSIAALGTTAWLSACGDAETTGAGGAAAAASGTETQAGNTTTTTHASTATGANTSSSTGGPLPPDPCIAANTCPPGVWINVTPADMNPLALGPTENAFGPGSIVGDPAHPNVMYVGGSLAGLYRSTDYGNTWTLVNDTLPDVPRGVTIAVSGDTVWAAGHVEVLKSTNGGTSFDSIPVDFDLYSLKIDPYDAQHMVSGLHEADGVAESTDGGETWNMVDGTGWPSGGVSWYPSFIDTADAATTRTTWLAIPQNGGGAVMTNDGGASWAPPSGLAGLSHGHGNSQMFQTGSTLFAAGTDGPEGQGVYRSTDLGANWSLVDGGSKPEAIVWGTPNHVYAMWAWACSNCDLGTNFETAALPDGSQWSDVAVVPDLKIGPNSLVVASDGTHQVFVGVMWAQGIWRYVEP